jgi:hypothetical protein
MVVSAAYYNGWYCLQNQQLTHANGAAMDRRTPVG